MFERAGGLPLDVVALGFRPVEQPRRVDQLIADVVAFDVADLDALGGKGVLRDLVSRVGHVVDEGRFADVRVPRDDDGGLVGPDVRQVLQRVAGVADRPEVVFDLIHDVGDAGEGLLAVFSGDVGVGLPQFRPVLPADLLDLAAGPHHLRERLAEFVDVDDGVGQFVVEGIDVVEVWPGGDDVLEVVGGDVDRDGEHRLLGLEGGFGPTGAGGPREGLVDEFLGPRGRRKRLENHFARIDGRALKTRPFGGVPSLARIPATVGGRGRRSPATRLPAGRAWRASRRRSARAARPSARPSPSGRSTSTAR